MSDLIAPDQIDNWMKKTPEWDFEETFIARVVEFDEFMDGIDFVNSVAEISDEANHHPDIDIRYLTVTLRVSTHEQGGLTANDFELAGRIDNLLD